MPKISNDYSRAKLYKIDAKSAASGPLIVMQHGYAPGDETFTESIFLLRRDGKWVDFVPLGAAGKPDLWDACLFDKSSDVLKLLNTSKMEAETYFMEIDPQTLAAWLNRTAGFTTQQRIDRLLEVYAERLRNRKP